MSEPQEQTTTETVASSVEPVNNFDNFIVNGNGETPETGETPDIAEGEGSSFESWSANQPDDVLTLIESHIESTVTGLKSALAAERKSAKDFAAQVAQLAQQTKGEDSQKMRDEIARLSADVEVANRRADFILEATQAGCTDVELAWAAAQMTEGATLAKIQERHPSIFASTATTDKRKPNLDAGNTNGASSTMTPNQWLRQAASKGGAAIDGRVPRP